MRKFSPFVKSIAVLSTGSIIAQGLTAISIPILTHIYGPTSMGEYTYVISICAIFMGVINLRYDIPIVTDEDESNVYPLIKLALLIGISIALVSLVCIGFYFYCTGKPLIWTVYIFFILIAYALVNVLTAFNNRRKHYKIISSVYVVRTAMQDIGGIITGIIKPLSHGLLLAYTLGQYLGIRQQIKPTLGEWEKIWSCSSSRLKHVLYIHKKQPLFSMPALLANSLSYSLIAIFVESLYGLEEVGLYSISMKFLGLPLALFAGNIGKVFTEQASREFTLTHGYYNTYKKTLKLLFIIAIPMVLLLMLLATPICTYVLGEKWTKAGTYIVILAPMFGVRFMTSSVAPAFVIARKQQQEARMQLLFLLSNIISWITAKNMHLDIFGFLTLISGLFTTSYIIYSFYIYKNSRPIA